MRIYLGELHDNRHRELQCDEDGHIKSRTRDEDRSRLARSEESGVPPLEIEWPSRHSPAI